MPEQDQQKEPIRERHGFTTFWLGYLIVNGLTAILLFTFFKKDVAEILQMELTDQYCYFMIGIGILNAISAFLLLSWKKIGFHGIIVSSILSMYLSLQMGSGIGASLLAFAQTGVLYLVLQLKKNNRSAWEWLD